MTQVLELFPPFWSKKFCAWYFSRFQPKKWTQEEELWRKGCVCFKGPKWKEISSEIRLSCDSRGLPVRTQSRGCFIVAGLSTESVTPMSVRTERDSLPTCRNVSSSQFWGGIEKSPCSSLEAQHWELRECWKGQWEGGRHQKCLTVIIFSSGLALCNSSRNKEGFVFV